MVVETDLEKLKIDVVDELHKVRRKHLNTPPEEIEKAVAEVLAEIEKRRKKISCYNRRFS